MPIPKTFEKHIKNVVKKRHLKKKHILRHFQKLETGCNSICRSVMASGFQKWCYSLKNYRVIDVWSQCKKCDWGSGVAGPTQVWVSDFVKSRHFTS